MARRRQAARANQAPKSKKRPRAYHHGQAQGRVNETKIQRALPAFERAERNEAEVAAVARATRVEIADWRTLLESLEHAAPFVPVLGR